MRICSLEVNNKMIGINERDFNFHWVVEEVYGVRWAKWCEKKVETETIPLIVWEE